MDRLGQIVLIVFTKSGKLLIVNSKQMHDLAEDYKYEVVAKDLKEEIEDSDDLYNKLKEFMN